MNGIAKPAVLQTAQKEVGITAQTQLKQLAENMMLYYSGDAKRIAHFIKVHDFAQRIAEGEGLDNETIFRIEAAALVHDIGIKNCEKKYGSCPGPMQEKEGPPEAEKMLSALGFAPSETARICAMVGKHHTYSHIDGIDLQILIEADFLVNLFEDGCGKSAVKTAYRKYFKTKTGKWLCRTIYGLESEQD